MHVLRNVLFVFLLSVGMVGHGRIDYRDNMAVGGCHSVADLLVMRKIFYFFGTDISLAGADVADDELRGSNKN